MEIQALMLGQLAKENTAVAVVKKVNSGVNQYKDLDKQEKQISLALTVLGVAAAGFVAYKGYKAVQGGFDFMTGKKWQDERDEIQVKNQAVDQSELMQQKEAPTLSVRQAKTIAFGLYEAFRNTQPEWSFNLWDEGTDEDNVFSNLAKIKNHADWLIVSIHYGSPRKRTLTQELIYELEDDELLKARKILIKSNVKI